MLKEEKIYGILEDWQALLLIRIPPTGLTDGALDTNEGSATISDENGNLLFYTDGSSAYDRNGDVMLNGNFLGGNSTTTQSGVIVPRPGLTKLILYFFFRFSRSFWRCSISCSRYKFKWRFGGSNQ